MDWCNDFYHILVCDWISERGVMHASDFANFGQTQAELCSLKVEKLDARIEWQCVTSQTLCNHFRGAKDHGFPMENEHFVVARLLKQL